MFFFKYAALFFSFHGFVRDPHAVVNLVTLLFCDRSCVECLPLKSFAFLKLMLCNMHFCYIYSIDFSGYEK